jgi:hypothetical protein
MSNAAIVLSRRPLFGAHSPLQISDHASRDAEQWRSRSVGRWQALEPQELPAVFRYRLVAAPGTPDVQTDGGQSDLRQFLYEKIRRPLRAAPG